MTRRLLISALLISVGVAPALEAQARQATPPPAAAQAATGNVAVAVTYTGKGVVDATHQILVLLFSTPQVGPTSKPLMPPQFIQKNGGTATFTGVTVSPVYVAAVFNEKGDYHGQGGPPPSGSPYTLHADAKGAMLPVKANAGASVMLLFDGSKRRP